MVAYSLCAVPVVCILGPVSIASLVGQLWEI